MHNRQGDGLPARAALHPTGLYLAMSEIDPRELRDPFMSETIARCKAPQAYTHIAPGELGRAPPGSAPAGLIFHVGRCGSTLVSQLLKEPGELVVYAEPQPVNEILQPPQPWPRQQLVGALRSLAAAFARHARRPYVLKLTSWNTLYAGIVAEAFPHSPWVFCLRDPVEVCVSLLQRPPGWRRAPGVAQRFAAIVDPGQQSSSQEELMARVYGALCDGAARLDPGRGRLVEYETLPAAIWRDVAPLFSLPVDVEARQRMAQAATRHAKAPATNAAPFAADSAAKQAAASATLRQAIDALARPAIERLRAIHR